MWNVISLVQVWTRVAVSISYDDNRYTTGTSMLYSSDCNPFDYYVCSTVEWETNKTLCKAKEEL